MSLFVFQSVTNVLLKTSIERDVMKPYLKTYYAVNSLPHTLISLMSIIQVLHLLFMLHITFDVIKYLKAGKCFCNVVVCMDLLHISPPFPLPLLKLIASIR